MDKVYINNLVKRINTKKSKKEITAELNKYITYVYSIYYIYLDDYKKINDENVPILYESLNKDFLKSDMKYIDQNKGIMDISIKNIINDPAFFKNKPIGIYVGPFSCYHNAGMQIILRISDFLKFVVNDFEELFNYCKRVVITNNCLNLLTFKTPILL